MDILTITLGAVFLLLFPLGEVVTITFGQGIRINPLDVGAFFITFVGLFYWLLHKKTIPKLFIWFGVFLLTCIISLLVNSFKLRINELTIAILYFFRFIMYAGSVVTVWMLPNKKKLNILIILFGSGCLLLFFGYIQYFFFPSLRGLTYEGWDPHLYRMFGTFLDPNFFGSFLVLFILLSLYLLGLWKKYKVVLTIITFLAVIGLFLTFSRSAYIALGVGIVTFLFCKGYKRKIAQSLGVLLVIGLLVVFLLARQSEGTNLLRTASTAARFNNLFRAGKIIQDYPIFGVGFNAYKYAQHTEGFIGGMGWEDSHSSNGVNNSYLFVWATTGIIGLIAYVLFLWKIYMYSLQEKQYGALVFASFAAISINSLFENSLFYSFILLWLFVLCGLIVNNEQ